MLHAKLQLLARQIPAPLAGALQVAPQPPQFLAFELVSTQAPSHAVSALVQAMFPEVLLGVEPSPRRTHCPLSGAQT